MKRVRKLTATGDYLFGQNTSNFVVGIESVSQMILTKLRLLRGEWWEDLLDGLPVVQEILNTYNLEVASVAASSLCVERVLEVDGVVDVEESSISIDRESRKVTVSLVVNTEYGRLEQVVEL